MFTPSTQQAAVLEWTSNGFGSAIVRAVAGSGKTTTLVELLARTRGTVAFTAYNKAIATEIATRVEPLSLGNRVRCGTFHSFGYGAVRKAFPNVKLDARQRALDVATYLTPALLNSMEDRGAPENVDTSAAIALINKTIGFAKQRGFGALVHYTDHKAWLDLADHFGLEEELPEDGTIEIADILEYARAGLEWSAQHVDIIDFEDMIWLPVVRRLRMWQNDWILVDEAQDTNPVRRALARMMLRPSGRAVFVGDERQAIYGFTGADGDALDLIRHEFNAQDLPLTVTFRCPKAIVEHAHQWVEHIQAADTAPEGVVAYLSHQENRMNEETQELEQLPWYQFERGLGKLTADDAVLCRNTKPLVELAYSLIRHGIACHVEGKEIGAGLLKLCNKWSRVRICDKLRERLEDWLQNQVARLTAKGQEVAAGNLTDRVETLFVLMEGCTTVADLTVRITKMFSDTPEGQPAQNLTLSTIHKSKGREWNRVYWLGRARLQPSIYARKEWELNQEDNLCYVAATRAKKELVEVDLPSPNKENNR